MNTSVRFVFRGIVLSACLSLSLWSHAAEVERANTSSEAFVPVELAQQITHVLPMTGLVMWPDHERMAQYQHTISMEFHYCLPCRDLSTLPTNPTLR